MIGGYCRVWHTLLLICHAKIEVRRRFLRLTLDRLLQGGDGLRQMASPGQSTAQPVQRCKMAGLDLQRLVKTSNRILHLSLLQIKVAQCQMCIKIARANRNCTFKLHDSILFLAGLSQ